MSLPKQTIGQMNGRWALLFKILLGLNSALIIPVCTWAWWVTSQLIDIKYRSGDRITGSMFVEIQDRLNDHNPAIQWLTAREIREIQRSQPPYSNGR